MDFSKPCNWCAQGAHEKCKSPVCGCIEDHSDDTQIMRGFKRLKRQLHPERASQTRKN